MECVGVVRGGDVLRGCGCYGCACKGRLWWHGIYWHKALRVHHVCPNYVEGVRDTYIIVKSKTSDDILSCTILC